jgi:hypothetical protein
MPLPKQKSPCSDTSELGHLSVAGGARYPRMRISRGSGTAPMPVFLTTPDEVELWMTAPLDEALELQQPMPNESLRIVARGTKEDPVVTSPIP